MASAPMAGIAKQDAWIGMLAATAYGLIIMLIYYFLGSRYPGLTLIGILRQLLGKWFGLILAACYFMLFFFLSFNIPWYIMDFMGHAMHETPHYAISLLFIIGYAVAAIYGIEVIARTSEIFIKFITVIFFAAMLMVLPNVKLDNLLPVLENGLVPVIKSSVSISIYNTFPMIVLLMVFPVNINDIKGSKKAIIKGFLWSSLLAFTVIILSTLVLGTAVLAKSKYPSFLLLKEINIMNIFTRLEYFISVVWIITQFIVGALFFYSSVAGLSELLKLKDYKKIVLPLSLIVFIMSGVVFPNDVYNLNWLVTGWTPYSILMGLIIPVFLLIVYGIRKMIAKYFT